MRSLIQFDLNAISSSIADGTVSQSAEFDLKIFLARGTEVNRGQVVYAHIVSQSWAEGQGYFYQDLYTERDGVTWKQRETASLWNNSGSDYLSSPTSSATTTLPIADMTFDVTTIVRSWISGTYNNNGFLLKFSDSDESQQSNEGRLYFFSKDTHTVFVPSIVAKWDNAVYSTGSLNTVGYTDLIAYPTNLRRTYKQNEVVRVDITARSRSPLKTFSTQFSDWENQHLPQQSYFSIVDMRSNEIIIPFDAYSKISSDSTGNYFTFVVEKMFPKRFYKVVLKVITPTGYQYMFDNSHFFGVEV
jgi:hypothetical protein